MTPGGVAEAGGEQVASADSQGCYFPGGRLEQLQWKPNQRDHMSYYVYKYNTNKYIYIVTIFIHILM